MIVIKDDIGEHRDAILQLDALASSHYNDFVFGDEQRARRVQRMLFDSGEAEYCPPGVHVAVIDGQCVGMLAMLPAAEVRRRRLANAMLLARARDALTGGERHRLALGSAVLLRPEDGDSYLARIAVMPEARGRGVGLRLLRRFVEESAAAGARRGVLAVAAENAGAIAFYRQFGFVQFGAPVARDEETGRALPYLHLAFALAPREA
jgi:ribosomal protein S18 acetylase RimI-like enzyme